MFTSVYESKSNHLLKRLAFTCFGSCFSSVRYSGLSSLFTSWKMKKTSPTTTKTRQASAWRLSRFQGSFSDRLLCLLLLSFTLSRRMRCNTCTEGSPRQQWGDTTCTLQLTVWPWSCYWLFRLFTIFCRLRCGSVYCLWACQTSGFVPFCCTGFTKSTKRPSITSAS